MLQWVEENRETFERDVLHDFCVASFALSEQFIRFKETGTLSFPTLRTLVGEPMNKGLLWRLKDKAHHIFRMHDEKLSPGTLLDWTLGYIFHESLKLMEDAHQQQYYGTRLSFPPDPSYAEALHPVLVQLHAIKEQTGESILREVTRLERLLQLSRQLFCRYFAGKPAHRPLARFLYDHKDLVQQAFSLDYPPLLASIYAHTPDQMYIEAAKSLLESARLPEAARAVAKALHLNPENPTAQALQKSVSSNSPK